MKNKRFVFVALIIVLLFSAFAVSAIADNKSIAVASTDFQTHQGEGFLTTIFVPDNANIVDFDVTLRYDTDLVTLQAAEENDQCKGSLTFNTEVPGIIRINYTRTSQNITKQQPILDLTFLVDENAGVGVYELLSVDKSETYMAHRLNSNSTLTAVDFECDFAKLVVYEIGDVDLSTVVDIGDATYIRRHLAQFEGSILTGFKLSLADTYSDGVVDIADAVCLQRHLARLDVIYGNRINVSFYGADGNKYATKSVLFNGTLNSIPTVPDKENFGVGKWSLSATEFVQPVFTELTKDLSVYAYYDPDTHTTDAIEYYKSLLSDMYYSGDLPTNLSSDLVLRETLNYQSGYHAALVWNSSSNYVLNSTTGSFTQPTYPQELDLGIRIISYDSNNAIEGEDSISFNYDVPGLYFCPTKSEVEGFLEHYFTDDADGKYRVNYDVKLVSKLNNTFIPVEGNLYDNFEIRLNWYQNIDGELAPLNQIKRTTTRQVNDYVAVATFNGKPLEDDGKIYIDNVEVTAIDEMEIKNYIINQIAAHQGTMATNGTSLWNNDTVYGTNVIWETGNAKIGYVANNVIQLKDDAISGMTLPLNARVSYAVDGGTNEFVLAYNLTVSCDNEYIRAPENMDLGLYKAIKMQLEETLGYRGDLTSAALSNVKFVNLDLSEYQKMAKEYNVLRAEHPEQYPDDTYPEITSFRGLSYCTYLRTLNISGIEVTDASMNQIATLSYLEAFIARGCNLDNLTDGGTPTLRNAVRLKMLDLTDNNFTSLDSVFAEGVRYGSLREVYLSKNKLTNINALSRAPMMTYLSLSENGLTSEGITAIANYPYLLYLSLANNKIDSVSSLTGLKYLKELRLQGNQLTSVNDLRRLMNLEILYIGHNRIQDIGFLNSLAKLSILYANDNRITQIDNLTALTKLEAINVSNNNIASLSVLRYYKTTLTEIYAENNRLTDFSFINGADKLHILMLAGNKTELAQENMSTWLSGLPEMEVLTLSQIRLTDLSFLSAMNRLVRLDVDGCGLSALNGDVSNIALIGEKYATLRVLNISNNDFSGYEDQLQSLRNATLLTVFYADNICDALDAYTLTYSMTELRFVSLENNGITDNSWLSKFDKLVYVDLAGNNISSVDLNVFLSNASQKTIQELYMDTNVNCSFANAYYLNEFNVQKLSLAGVSIDTMKNMPAEMENIEYLNLSDTNLTNLTGLDVESDAGMEDLYSIERHATLKVVDVSNVEAKISPLENLAKLETVYAVGAVDSELFHKDNLHSLQRLHNKGVTCYLYDRDTEYVPTATKEGVDILNLIDDFSCDVTVAAENVFSDNNPFIVSEINDYVIDWTLSNNKNYEIQDNHLSVKSYEGIEDEALTITATIKPYPDQGTVSRSFTVNTHILRATPDYYEITAEGYGESLTRDASFSIVVRTKANQTEGFTDPVKPVEDAIQFRYDAETAAGMVMPYSNIVAVSPFSFTGTDDPAYGIREGYGFAVNSGAPLGAKFTVKIDMYHLNATGGKVYDIEQVTMPVTIASRTFTATFVLNGGTLVDDNGVNLESREFVEDSLIFNGLTFSRPGYVFDGWYTDAGFTNLFSADGTDAIMPSENITLHAKWNALSYTVFFDANGGSVSTASIQALSDVALGELPVPERQYYTFDGWFTEATDGEVVTAESAFARTEDLTLYAHWTLNSFIVTFNPNGGTVGTSEIRAYCGQALGTLPTPSRTGFTFNGWFTAASGGSQVTASTTYSVANDITLYARWTVLSYTVSWSTGTGYSITVKRTSSPYAGAPTGNLSSGSTVYYGDVLSITYTPATGYTLGSHGSTSVTVTGNVGGSIIYASATVNSYTYNVVYKSSNGTALGSTTVTKNYGTTNTITAPAKTGYNTPGSQSVKWDSTSAKTITFSYTPTSVSSGNQIASGVWWNYNGKDCITYSIKAEYRNRTASSVQIRIVWTNTIKSGSWYGYGQYFNCGSGNYTICTSSTWSSSASSNRSQTAYSDWLTIPVSATQTSVSMWLSYWDQCNRSGHPSGTVAIPTY